jgi:hypothetical protein
MASQAAKQVKFGFWVAAGFTVFAIILSIMLALSMWAIGGKHA